MAYYSGNGATNLKMWVVEYIATLRIRHEIER